MNRLTLVEILVCCICTPCVMIPDLALHLSQSHNVTECHRIAVSWLATEGLRVPMSTEARKAFSFLLVHWLVGREKLTD